MEIWGNFFRGWTSSMHTSHPWHGSRRIYVAIQEQCLRETSLQADRFQRHAKAAPTSGGFWSVLCVLLPDTNYTPWRSDRKIIHFQHQRWFSKFEEWQHLGSCKSYLSTKHHFFVFEIPTVKLTVVTTVGWEIWRRSNWRSKYLKRISIMNHPNWCGLVSYFCPFYRMAVNF